MRLLRYDHRMLAAKMLILPFEAMTSLNYTFFGFLSTQLLWNYENPTFAEKCKQGNQSLIFLTPNNFIVTHI